MIAVGRRLLGFGYWGPLLLAVVVARIATTPEHSGTGLLLPLAAGAVVLVPLLHVLLGAVGAPAAAVPAEDPAEGSAKGPAEEAAPSAAPRGVRRPPRPGNSVLLGCLLACGALVLGFSVPGRDYGLLGIGLATLVLLPFAWTAWQVMIALQAAQAVVRPTARTRGRQQLGLWRWAAAPLMVGTAVLLIGNDVPQEARFAMGRSALTSFAERALAAGSVDPAPTRIGAYHVQDTELVDGGVKFAVSGTGLFAHHGFAYFPPGGPVGHRDEYTQIGGRWYSWSGVDHF
ncbi:hypothetical protein [Kitasatospora sp. NE20-6]|uniref:hypothetical protein n=1 Tax=Kitasatospora sp. NE20-6 TaxID=2859066 RepID=UPI0038B2370E